MQYKQEQEKLNIRENLTNKVYYSLLSHLNI